jgi:hypothetical protein
LNQERRKASDKILFIKQKAAPDQEQLFYFNDVDSYYG